MVYRAEVVVLTISSLAVRLPKAARVGVLVVPPPMLTSGRLTVDPQSFSDAMVAESHSSPGVVLTIETAVVTTEPEGGSGPSAVGRLLMPIVNYVESCALR